jgi:hypothetical protein
MPSPLCLGHGLVLLPILRLRPRHDHLITIRTVEWAGLIRGIGRRSFDDHRRMLVPEIALDAHLLVYFPLDALGSTVSGMQR